MMKSVLLVFGFLAVASAYPYCDVKGEGQCGHSGSYCMIDPLKHPPYLCHGASRNSTACGISGNESSVPAFVSRAQVTIQQCVAAGNGTSTFCSAQCRSAFTDYITYGDANMCFQDSPLDTGTYFIETRGEIDQKSDASGCQRTGGTCADDSDCHPGKGKCIGTSSPAVGSYCECDAGFAGLYCGTPFSCPGNCSGDHGVCFPGDDELNGKCHCKVRWKADNCSVPSGVTPAPTKAPTTPAPTKAPTTPAPPPTNHTKAPTKAPTVDACGGKCPTDKHQTCDAATKQCVCAHSMFPAVSNHTDRSCYFYCAHPSPVEHDWTTIIQNSSEGTSFCVCAAQSTSGLVFTGQHCNDTVAAPPNGLEFSVYLTDTASLVPTAAPTNGSSWGDYQSAGARDRMTAEHQWIEKAANLVPLNSTLVYMFRNDLAYYLSSNKTWPTTAGNHKNSFDDDRLQPTDQDGIDTVYGERLELNGTAVVKMNFAVASVFNTSDTAAALSALQDTDTLAKSCAASPECRQQYGLKQYDPPPPADNSDDGDSGLPWWAILLIVLGVLLVLLVGFWLWWRWRRQEQAEQPADHGHEALLHVPAEPQDESA